MNATTHIIDQLSDENAALKRRVAELAEGLGKSARTLHLISDGVLHSGKNFEECGAISCSEAKTLMKGTTP